VVDRTRHTTMTGRADGLVAEFLDSSAWGIHQRLGSVAGVAVTTAEGDRPRTFGASTVLAAEVDQIQFEVGVGPCLEALREGTPLYVPDLADDDRWGEYGPRAAQRGAASCVSVPVVVRGETVAVFKVYAAQRDGLSAGQRRTAALTAQEIAGGFALAVHVTSQAAELDDLTALMAHRRVIDLALGICMQRVQVPAETAFGLLRQQSQHRNVKLHEVAAEVVSSIPGTSADDLVPHFNPHA
jgi:GAF domain-containing protein